MLNRQQIEAISKQAATLPAQIGSMQTNLQRQTALLERQVELAEASQPKVKPLPQFLDLTMADPSLVTGETLRFVRAWISAFSAQAIEPYILHLGERGTFFSFWLPVTGGVFQILPADDDYPWIVARGVRVWIEGPADVDFHCKLIAFPT